MRLEFVEGRASTGSAGKTSRELAQLGHGGVSAKTIERCAAAGVDSFVAGSSVFGAEDPDAAVTKLRELATVAAP